MSKNVPFGVSVGCLEGVWKVSGGCLNGSVCCLDGYDMQAIDKYPFKHIFNSSFLFSQLSRIGQNMPYFGMSLGCLEDVWGCLSDSYTFWGCYNTKSIDTNPIRVILISCTLSSQWPFFAVFEPKIPNFRSDVEG